MGCATRLPTIVSMTGLQIGYLILGAALFVEIIFSWPGLGLEIYKSVVGRDMPMMLGLVLFSTFVFVVLNLFVDIIYRLINSRARGTPEHGRVSRRRRNSHPSRLLPGRSHVLRYPARLLHSPTTTSRSSAGAIIVALVVFVAIFAPVLSPYSPIQVHPLDRLKGYRSRPATCSAPTNRGETC